MHQKIDFSFFPTPHLCWNGQSNILDKYLELAFTQNLSIQNSELEKNKQQIQIELAKKQWGPSVDIQTNYLLAKGGRTLNFPIGDLLNPAYGALNDITGTNDFPNDLANQEIQLTPNNFFDAQLTIQQPIIYSALRYNYRIQQELLKTNDLEIDLTKREIALQVKTAYYNYLKSLEAIKIINTSEILLMEVLEFNKS